MRSVSHSGVVGQVLVEYTVGSATFDRDRVRTWRWYQIIQDVIPQLWSYCTGLEDIGVESSNFQGGWQTGYLEMHTVVVISHEGERVGGCAAYQIIGDDELQLLTPLGTLEALWF